MLFGKLQESFLASLKVLQVIHFDARNLHFTDSDVRQFSDNLKSGMLEEQELIYYCQKRLWNKDYFRQIMISVFSDLLKFYQIMRMVIGELFDRIERTLEDADSIFEMWR